MTTPNPGPRDGGQEAASSMLLSGMHVVRSICNPIADPDEVPELTFTLWAGGMEDKADLEIPLIFGEVLTSNVSESHLLGVTVLAMMHPGERFELNPRDDDQSDAFLRTWGPWASHALWDYALTQLRILASGLFMPDLDLPQFTPDPYLTFANNDTTGGPQSQSSNDEADTDTTE